MKTALIVEGGGMKCAYSAGVLDSFLDEAITFDIGIGVSAGCANVLSFQAGQRDRNRRFYCIHVKDPKYISIGNLIKTGSLFGLEYIYGNMTNEGGTDPLDYDALMANPAEYMLVTTNAITGQPRYIFKNEIPRNHYQAVMASCALPAMCKPIFMDGVPYYDGGVSDSIPVDKALELGYDRLVVVLSKPGRFHMDPQGGRLAYTAMLKKKYPKTVEALNHRHQVYNAQMARLVELEQEGKAMVFAPSADIKIGTYTTDPAVMQALYDNGLSEATERVSEVREFLGITQES